MFSASVSAEGEPQLILGMVVTGEYFQTVGTRPAMGRLLAPSDDRGAAGADPVVVLSHRVWIRRFGADSGVIGRTIVLNRQPLTVVGVAERGFQGHLAALDVGAWVPMGLFPRIGDVARLDAPNSSWLELIGRRAEGADIRAIASRLSAVSITAAEGRDSSGVDVRDYVPVPAQQSLAIGGFFGVLLVICGVILFIGSVNVGGVLLSRATARIREIAIRLAIGARRHYGVLVREWAIHVGWGGRLLEQHEEGGLHLIEIKDS
jgi:ABC-type antimicrobial peptide transport system permease subunit